MITGGFNGIGRASALAFAPEGADIVIGGRRDEAGHALADELRAGGGQAEYVRADVRRADEVRNLVDALVRRFGRRELAVKDAGTQGEPGPITEQTGDSDAATCDTKVLGTNLRLKRETRGMLGHRRGSIVNRSSTWGRRGAPGASQ